jgi:hypothetical protein
VTSPDPDPDVWKSPFEELLDQGTASLANGFGAVVHMPDPTFGTPGEDTAFWEGKQQLSDDCAIKCQQFILEQFTGHAVDEVDLVGEAMEHGWYAPGKGTTPENVGNLLELHGVGVTHYEHGNQFHLAMELAQGHKVIVGVESDSLWNHNPILDFLRDLLGIHGSADHAVVVSGIDTSDPEHVVVQVSDPGTGQPLASYPMEQFLDAWRGSDFFMVATHDPAPAHLPEMAHFDYAVGHIADVAGQPYDQFLEYADRPSAYGDVIHHHVEQDDAGQHPLHDPAAAEQYREHAGQLGARDGHSADIHHDLVTDPHHHDASHGDADMANDLPDEHTHHDLS